MSDIPKTDNQAVQEKTQVGNYFISNYPPFSFWSPDNVVDVQRALEHQGDPQTPLGLYVHIPFCRKRCHFCYFRVYTGVNSSQVNTTLDGVVNEMKMYADKPFVNGRRPEFIYFGGGTPSFLSTTQLKSLTDRLKEYLPWDQAKEVAFECEPGTLTESKLEVIKEIGVTRLSLGVENFKDEILEYNGRAHRSKEVFKAYDFARKLGFDHINIDLIAGMMGETETNWKECVDKALEMQPDALTVYQMEIPYNTTIYKEMKEKHEDIAPVADWQTKRDWVDYAFNKFQENGYAVNSAYTVVKDPDKVKFLYRDRLWEGADLVSLGVASFSHVNGTHFQNEHDLDTYLTRVTKGELPVYRALTPTDDERFIREFVLQCKLGHVAVEYFEKKFGQNLIQRFGEIFEQYQQDGYLSIQDGEIQFSRLGLLQVDRLLTAFFLPEHKNVRYA